MSSGSKGRTLLFECTCRRTRNPEMPSFRSVGLISSLISLENSKRFLGGDGLQNSPHRVTSLLSRTSDDLVRPIGVDVLFQNCSIAFGFENSIESILMKARKRFLGITFTDALHLSALYMGQVEYSPLQRYDPLFCSTRSTQASPQLNTSCADVRRLFQNSD